MRAFGRSCKQALQRVRRRFGPARGAERLFDPDYYLERYPDLRAPGLDPYGHYLKFGAAEGRDPNPLFSTDWYLNQYRDVKAHRVNPLVHYCLHGASEGRDPHPRFDTDWYLARYPDVGRSRLNPLLHYLRSGAREGRAGHPSFEVADGGDGERRTRRLVAPGSPRLTAAEFGARTHLGRAGQAVQAQVLLIDSVYPTPDRDSGSIDAVNWIRILKQLGFGVFFISRADFEGPPADLVPRRAKDHVASLGAVVVDRDRAESVNAFIQAQGHTLALVILSRVYGGGEFLEQVRAHAPQARILFNTVDLHFLRERREAELRNDRAALIDAGWTEARELRLIGMADGTIVVSQAEADLLAAQLAGPRVFTLPLMRDIPGRAKGFAERRDIAFIGGFNHMPNVDAVRYFLEQVWPTIHAVMPQVRFLIVGADAPDEFVCVRRPGVDYVGYVESIGSVLDDIRLTVAPLRYGAGAKGKVISSLSHGVPCIGTEIAAEGMGLAPATAFQTVHSPAEFARKVIEIYGDGPQWTLRSDAGLAHVRRFNSIVTGANLVQEVLAEIGLRPDRVSPQT